MILNAADTIALLTPDSDVQAGYDTLREALFQVMNASDGEYAYRHSWKLVNYYARIDLESFMWGDQTALQRLQDKVLVAMMVLP
ncbi:hypothetical protein GCM10028807_51810 [Spirosoma daeguense]